MAEYLIDSHVHMQMDEFADEYDSILESCMKNNVGLLCNVGYDMESSHSIKDLIFPDGMEHYAFAGIHPHYAADITEEMYSEIDLMLRDGFFAGIGEIGLDRYWHKEEEAIDKQKNIFRMQLETAQSLKKPVALHIRDAYEEAFDIIRQYKLGNVEFHSFTGNAEQLERIVNAGHYFGINGVVTFKNSDLKNILRKEYIDRILIETDAPYLAPVPKRGKRNRPDYVVHIYSFLADLFSIDQEELAQKVYDNFKRFIGEKS